MTYNFKISVIHIAIPNYHLWCGWSSQLSNYPHLRVQALHLDDRFPKHRSKAESLHRWHHRFNPCWRSLPARAVSERARCPDEAILVRRTKYEEGSWNHWLRAKSKPETMVFTVSFGGVLQNFPETNPLWFKGDRFFCQSLMRQNKKNLKLSNVGIVEGWLSYYTNTFPGRFTKQVNRNKIIR